MSEKEVSNGSVSEPRFARGTKSGVEKLCYKNNQLRFEGRAVELIARLHRMVSRHVATIAMYAANADRVQTITEGHITSAGKECFNVNFLGSYAPAPRRRKPSTGVVKAIRDAGKATSAARPATKLQITTEQKQ